MKDVIVDILIGLILLVVINAFLFGIIGWCYAIYLVYDSNNWLPIGVLCGTCIIIIVMLSIVSAIYKFLWKS